MQGEIQEFQNAVESFRKQRTQKNRKDLQEFYRKEIKEKYIYGNKIASFVETVLSGQDPKLMIVLAEAVAQGLFSYGVTTSTLRNIFGYAKKLDVAETGRQGEISDETIAKIYILKPRIAYVEGKAESYSREGINLLRQVVEAAVEKIGKERAKFKNFIALFESIISYFRYYNPK